MNIQFQQLPLGALFEFRGRRYEKLALSMARDEDRCGNVFQDHAEVCWDRRPGEEPRPMRPQEQHWAARLAMAPGHA